MNRRDARRTNGLRVLHSIVLPSMLLVLGCQAKPAPEQVEKKPATFDAPRFESAYRSSKELEAVTATIASAPLPPWTPGVGADAEREGDFDRFNEALLRFTTETSIAKDKARTDQERRFAELYGEAGGAYRDSLSLWTQKRGAKSVYEGKIVYAIDGKFAGESMEPLVTKYGLSVVPMPGAKGFTLIAPEGIQKIWSHAQEKVREANRLYLGSD